MVSMEVVGTIGGAGSAIGLSCVYLATRFFMIPEGRSATQLIALAHIFMALFSVVLLPFIYTPPVNGFSSMVVPLLGVALTYLVAQGLLFYSLSRYTASNIAPLLGIKLIASAAISIFLGYSIVTEQWLAVGCACGAALLLRDSKEGMDLKGYLLVIGICLNYAISDWCVPYLIRTIDPDAPFRAVLQSIAYIYIFCGVLSVFLYKDVKRSELAAWKTACGYAVLWYMSMGFLFSAFAYIGVVNGVILQANRSVVSVVLAIILSKCGFSALETPVSRSMRVRQAFSALLMVAAVFLYSMTV